MDFGDGALAGGGIGAIVVGAVVQAARQLAQLTRRSAELADRAEALVAKLEGVVDRTSGTLGEVSQAAARVTDAADVVEEACGACTPPDDEPARGSRTRTAPHRPGQARKGERP